MKRMTILSTVLVLALVLLGPGCGGEEDTAGGESEETGMKQSDAASGGETTRLAPEKPHAAKDPGEVFARFGPEDNPVEVTRAEFNETLSQVLSRTMPGGETPSPEELPGHLKAQVLRQVVDSKLLEALVEQAEVEVTEEQVQAEMDKLKQQLQQQGMQIEQALAAQGMSMEDLQSQMRESLAVRKFVEQQTTNVEVSEAEIAEAYEQGKEAGQFDRQETVDVAHILVQVDEGAGEEAWAEAKKEIDKAAERLENGEDFATVAKEVSEDPGSKDRGGTYEGVQKGQMVPEFDKLAFETAVGEVTDPFRTKFGWHILTVTAKNEAGTAALEDVSEDIRDAKLQNKQREALTALIEKAREEMNVEILADFAQEPEAPAESGQEAPAEAGQAEAQTTAPEGAEKAPEAPATAEQPEKEGS